LLIANSIRRPLRGTLLLDLMVAITAVAILLPQVSGLWKSTQLWTHALRVRARAAREARVSRTLLMAQLAHSQSVTVVGGGLVIVPASGPSQSVSQSTDKVLLQAGGSTITVAQGATSFDATSFDAKNAKTDMVFGSAPRSAKLSLWISRP
jgi:hypothetical protein